MTHRPTLPCVALVALLGVLTSLGCTTSEVRSSQGFAPIHASLDGFSATLTGARVTSDGADAPDWIEYLLVLQNPSARSLTITNVTLLTGQGQYLAPAASAAEIRTPPDPALNVGGDVALGAAGIAAGQVIPFGGLFVQAVTSAARVSSADDRAQDEQRFRLRKMVGVELAPGGRMEGNAFFPAIADPRAIVIDFVRHGQEPKRLSLDLPDPSRGASASS